ncbi:hypothetical protein [Lactobacillus sp. Sy-1]|uniref:hypothetical protein n=1 Tax=Lactobacillus sp. Sy-1 TaxID=2109645 RepID=UPI001C56C163|nr:hypothetical protein [Lactobacillus sp. Sy-1]MBW1605299.1 hypothetical protein [Lactobacillus sp. Sy-1]
MSDKLFDFKELNDSAKHTAVKEFAIFYVHQYANNNMELIANYDVDGVVQDINRDLYINRFNLESTIISDSVSERFSKYAHLLENIDQKYFDNGHPEKNWDTWYEDKYASVQRGL